MHSEKELLIKLIQKHQQTSLNEKEKALLDNLVNQNDEYAAFFRITTKAAMPISNTDEAYAKVQLLIAQQVQSDNIKFPKIKVWNYAIAASILLCAFLGIFYSSFQSRHQLVYEVPLGKRTTFSLPDGTSVALNGGSKLVIDEQFGSKNRNVTLDGEGFFDVKHQDDNPFVVTSKELKIKVLGTAFNIRDYDDDDLKQTTLLRGKVELLYKKDNKETNYTLLPGDRITFSKNLIQQQKNSELLETKVIREKITKDSILKNNIAWKDNILIFDNDPLPLVVSKLEKWYNVKIEIKDKTLIDKHFTGSFAELSIHEILKLLKETGGLKKISNIDNTIIIE